MTAAKWAETADVKTVTGVDVEDVDRDNAARSLELHTGLIEDVERPKMTDRDRYWLKLALCYQAAWLIADPDYLERRAVASTSQDGQSATPGNPDWLTLAPLARKALKRLSFRGTRTIDTRGRGQRIVNVNDDRYESRLHWRRA